MASKLDELNEALKHVRLTRGSRFDIERLQMERLDRALNNAGLKNGARGVLFVLVYKVNKHGEAWCTEEEIAGKAMHAETAGLHLRALEAAGIVWRIARSPGLRSLVAPDAKIPKCGDLYFLPVASTPKALLAWCMYPGEVYGRPCVTQQENASAVATATSTKASPSPPENPHAHGPQLAEIYGFLSAVAEARKLRPDIPREAWVAAGRIRCARFNVDRDMCTARVVIAWAEHVLRCWR